MRGGNCELLIGLQLVVVDNKLALLGGAQNEEEETRVVTKLEFCHDSADSAVVEESVEKLVCQRLLRG